MAGRPPTATYKVTKSGQVVVEVGGGHTTAWMQEVEQCRSNCRVPFEGKDNITLSEGRRPTLFMQLKSGGKGDCHVANNP